MKLLVCLVCAVLIVPNGLHAKCTMTKKCLAPGLDNNDCVPEAQVGEEPLPMIGEGWANVTGGGSCKTSAECANGGTCNKNVCQCKVDGISAGLYCNETAIQCPEYKTSSCCSWQQNKDMAMNFNLIKSVFGSNKNGGCDACAANLMTLWCGIVCSPNQYNFLKLHSPPPSTANFTDPLTGKIAKVLEVDLVLHKKLTCGLFDSCRNTATASLAEGMKSSLGFLKYQAQIGSIGHGQYFHLNFDINANKSFHHDILRCENYSEVRSNQVKNKLPSIAQTLDSILRKNASSQCPCGACKKSCSSNLDPSEIDEEIVLVENPISIFTGFNVTLVLFSYLFIFLGSLLIVWRQGTYENK